MSIMRCDYCQACIDTDEDVEGVETPGGFMCLWCQADGEEQAKQDMAAQAEDEHENQ